MAEVSGRDREEGEERDGDTSEEEEEQATILYDVVSYREWEQEPEVVKKQGDVLQGKSRGGWLQLAPPPSILPPRVEAIQVSKEPLLWVYLDFRVQRYHGFLKCQAMGSTSLSCKNLPWRFH